jgi:DNA polymerase-1
MLIDTLSSETQEAYKDSPLWKPWMTERRLRQMGSLADLQEFLESGYGFPRISLDFETCDLSQTPESVCGVCLAFTDQEGIYAPIKHINYPQANLDPERVWELLLPVLEAKQVVVYNWKFEGNILRRKGFEKTCDLKDLQDAYIYRCLFDSEKDQMGLKDATEELIGCEMLVIHEVPGIKTGRKKSQINFAQSDPADATLYAAADPIFTLSVLDHCKGKVEREQKTTVVLEHRLYKTLFKMEDNSIMIDRAYVQQAIWDVEKWADSLRRKIWDQAKGEFNVDSTRELGKVLTKMGIKLPETEKKNLSTASDVLTPLSKEHPICADVLVYRSVMGEKSRYLEPLLSNTTENKPTAVFKFKALGAPTGRFSSGGVDDGDPVYTPMNPQAIESASAYKEAQVREVVISGLIV